MLGKLIRRRRTELQMSLAELANLVGVDPEYMHMVEQDESSPSVITMRRIAATLRAPLYQFLGEDEKSKVIRQRERRVVEIQETGVRNELLVPSIHRGTDVYISRLPPGSRDPIGVSSHSGEKCILVMEGSMRLRFGPESYKLSEGDSIYIDSAVPHFVEAGVDGAVIVTAVTPPSF